MKNLKKAFLFVMFLVILLPYQSPLQAQAFKDQYYYSTDVEHLFFHPLIAYPEIALKKQNPMRKSYLADCITPYEFLGILHSLYKNNYILVSLYDCFKIENGIAVKKAVKVPVGKKPIILSFDDVNYDSKKMGYGMVDKLIIDSDGDIACSTEIDRAVDISKDREFLPILEKFIKNHKDFSPFGARGTINLTGYDGILGYRTSHTSTSRYKEIEISNAINIVNKLKTLGWTFACHSYGHYHMKKISDEKFQNEIDNWNKEVKPLIGNTSAYVYPYGEWEVFDSEGNYTFKHQLLIDNGFKLFLGVGMKTFYSYLPSKTNNKVLFMDRKVVDGTTLCSNNKNLFAFFNPTSIIDPKREIINNSLT